MSARLLGAQVGRPVGEKVMQLLRPGIQRLCVLKLGVLGVLGVLAVPCAVCRRLGQSGIAGTCARAPQDGHAQCSLSFESGQDDSAKDACDAAHFALRALPEFCVKHAKVFVSVSPPVNLLTVDIK